MNNSNHIKSIKATYEGSKRYFGIEVGSPLSINNILSVIFYTDYDDLSFKFSYRK